MKEVHGMTPIGGLDQQILFYKDPNHKYDESTNRAGTETQEDGDIMLVETLQMGCARSEFEQKIT